MKKISLHRVILNLTAVINMVIFFFCCSGSKQIIVKEENKEVNYIPYYLKVYEADSLYLTGNYERSFEILDSLFKKFEPLDQLGIYELQTYVKSAYLTSNYNVLEPTFKRLLDTWGYNPSYIKYDSIMFNAWHKAGLSEKEIITWQQECKNKINWTLRDTLIVMHNVDQIFRGKKGEDSLDVVHKELLKYIFGKHGYPDPKLVGSFMLGVEFNHISDDIDEQEYQYFKDELIKFLKQGRSTQHQIAMLVDKREFDQRNKTIYGTFGTHESFGTRMVKFDTMEINKNRKSIGLPSIEYQQFKWDKFQSMFNQ